MKWKIYSPVHGSVQIQGASFLLFRNPVEPVDELQPCRLRAPPSALRLSSPQPHSEMQFPRDQRHLDALATRVSDENERKEYVTTCLRMVSTSAAPNSVELPISRALARSNGIPTLWPSLVSFLSFRRLTQQFLVSYFIKFSLSLTSFERRDMLTFGSSYEKENDALLNTGLTSCRPDT